MSVGGSLPGSSARSSRTSSSKSAIARPGRGTRSHRARRSCTLRAYSSAGRPSGTSWKTPSRPSSSRLISSQRAHGARARGRFVAENVGVSLNQLPCDATRGRLEVAAPPPGAQREEDALEQEVADLVEQLRLVAGERGVCDLVGLLDRVRHDRARCLLAVPRTFTAKALGQLLELDERVRERHLRLGRRVRRGGRRAGVGRRCVADLVLDLAPLAEALRQVGEPRRDLLILLLLQEPLLDRRSDSFSAWSRADGSIESGSITNHPYVASCTGAWIVFVFSEKATLSTSARSDPSRRSASRTCPSSSDL